MEREILGNILKLWKGRKQGVSEGRRNSGKRHMGSLEGNDENPGVGREMCDGEDGINTKECAPFSQRREKDKETEGRGWAQDIRCRGAAEIQDRTEQSFCSAEAEQLQIQSFSHVWFCTMFNFMTPSNDP